MGLVLTHLSSLFDTNPHSGRRACRRTVAVLFDEDGVCGRFCPLECGYTFGQSHRLRGMPCKVRMCHRFVFHCPPAMFQLHAHMLWDSSWTSHRHGRLYWHRRHGTTPLLHLPGLAGRSVVFPVSARIPRRFPPSESFHTRRPSSCVWLTHSLGCLPGTRFSKMSTVDIPLDKAELLSVLLEAFLYGKTRLQRIVGRGTDRSWVRPFAGDVRRNDLDAVVPTAHSLNEP